MALAASRARCWQETWGRLHDPRQAGSRDGDAPRPVSRREARRAEGDAAARGRCAAAKARQRTYQGAGARLPLEADVGVRKVHDDNRIGRARGDRALLHDPCAQAHNAVATPRGGHLGWSAP